jgi:hypothetical protein
MAVAAVAPAAQDAKTAGLAELLDHAGRYVTRFESEFRAVISDEDYEQHVIGRLWFGRRERRLHSEMVFLLPPDRSGWLTVRNVASIDGRPVTDKEDGGLGRLLADPTIELPAFRALRERSARFNIGSIQRTTNDPNLVLLFLEPARQDRFAFKVEGQERINDVTAWKIAFAERRRPTVIQDGASGADLFSQGSIWVSEPEGAVVRTEVAVALRGGTTHASIKVDYAQAPRFTMWVPIRMQEDYTQWDSRSDGQSTVLEHVECLATYSNFRQFETSGRLLPVK